MMVPVAWPARTDDEAAVAPCHRAVLLTVAAMRAADGHTRFVASERSIHWKRPLEIRA